MNVLRINNRNENIFGHNSDVFVSAGRVDGNKLMLERNNAVTLEIDLPQIGTGAQGPTGPSGISVIVQVVLQVYKVLQATKVLVALLVYKAQQEYKVQLDLLVLLVLVGLLALLAHRFRVLQVQVVLMEMTGQQVQVV